VKDRLLDDLDVQILRELAENCRSPINYIAKKLGQPKSTIHYRIRRLEDAGIIQGCTLRVDEKRLGWMYSLVTMVYARYGRDSLKQLGEALAGLPEVWAAYKVLGEPDFLVLSKHRSPEDVQEFLERLTSLDGVERVASTLILEPVKEDPTVIVRRLASD